MIMTAEEKKQIYSLLKTVADWSYGCPAPGFDNVAPNFCDDEIQNDISINSSTNALDGIITKISNCNRCQLHKTRTNTVPGMGVNNPVVLVIGEGPGADEDASGLPFVGKAGQLLDKMLAAISLSRTSNCYIANIVKCRPPANRDPLPEECEACSSYLVAQITTLKPKMILALGRVAIQNLLQTTDGIGKLRGYFHDYKGIPLLATYHPSALLRNPDLKRPAWEDLKIFRDRLNILSPDYDIPFKAEQNQ